jgi:hypothetical protein
VHKADTLAAWKALPDGLPILPHFQPIPYKASGSTYGACGVRIDGSPAFVDAVLSRLKDVIDGENHITRLALSRNVVDGSGIGKALPNSGIGAECCYIRLHMRGGEGAIASAVFDRHLQGATNRFAEAHNITPEG